MKICIIMWSVSSRNYLQNSQTSKRNSYLISFPCKDEHFLLIHLKCIYMYMYICVCVRERVGVLIYHRVSVCVCLCVCVSGQFIELIKCPTQTKPIVSLSTRHGSAFPVEDFQGPTDSFDNVYGYFV